MDYQSTDTVVSKAVPGVTFTVRRMSFARRVELTRRIRELAGKAEYHQAATDPLEKLDAAALAVEIDCLYLCWGLTSIEDLTIDGQAATAELLIAHGPEELCGEIVAAVKVQCGLSDEERKN